MDKPLYELVDDIFEPEKKAARTKRQDEIDKLVRAAQTVLATYEGRQIFWWFISRGNLFSSTYSGRSLDQAHMDGQRMMAAEAFALALKADPHILTKMIAEKLTINKENSHV